MNRSLRAGLLLAWLAYGLFWGGLVALQRPTVPLGTHLLFNVWLLLPTVLTPLLVPPLARRLRIVPGRVARGVALHVVLGTAFAAAEIALAWQLGVLRPPFRPWGVAAFHLLLRNLLAYLLVAAVVHARGFLDAWRDEQVRAARLRAELAQAALEAACWRVQPQIVLPALDRIERTLVTEPEEADEQLALLGELLRRLLQEPERRVATVADETDALVAAATLTRGAGTVRLDVEPDARHLKVPRLGLLPLAAQAGSGPVHVRASTRGGGLLLEVDGADLTALDPAPFEALWPRRVRRESGERGPRLLLPAEAM